MTVLKTDSTTNVSHERRLLGAADAAVHLPLKNAALGLCTIPYAFTQYLQYMLLHQVLAEIITTSNIACCLK